MRCEECERKNPLASLVSSVLPQVSSQSHVSSFMFGLRRHESNLSPKHQKRGKSKNFIIRRGARSD